MGTVTGTAKQIIDADGAIVTPGFTDIHTHYDGQVSWDEEMAPSSLQRHDLRDGQLVVWALRRFWRPIASDLCASWRASKTSRERALGGDPLGLGDLPRVHGLPRPDAPHHRLHGSCPTMPSGST